jgi:glycosyltransferase involved in cell wall biosynthesis
MSADLQPRNILFLNPDPRRSAGSNLSLFSIIAGFDRSRFRPIVALPKNNEYSDLIQRLEIETLYYESNYWNYHSVDHFYNAAQDLRDRVSMLASEIRGRDIGLVITNAEYAFEGALAAALEGVPHIWVQRVRFCSADIEALKFFPLSDRALAELIFDLSTRVVVNGRHLLDAMCAPQAASKMVLIEPGLQDQHQSIDRSMERSRLRKRIDALEDSKIVLNVSRISEEKDLATYLRVARQVCQRMPPDQVHFVHVGGCSGDSDQQLEALNKLRGQLNLQAVFHFVGKLELQEVQRVMHGADLFLFTSITEGFARTCAEAMLAELPVVSTRSGGPEGYIEDGVEGYLCTVGDVDGLAEKAVYLLQNEGLATNMGVKGREKMLARVDERIVNERWLKVISAALDEPRGVSDRALRIEIFINILTHLGKVAVNQRELRQRLERAETLNTIVLGNPFSRWVKSLVRRRRA